MRAAFDGTDQDVTFAEGHELDAQRAARIPVRGGKRRRDD
jgi:hypothetical protein